jgi:hypothetical protein
MPARLHLFARIAPSLAGLAALFVVMGLWLGGVHSAYDDLLRFWGIVPFQFPFADIDGSLAAWDCARRGVDIIISDPCDILKRPYNYSPFWMTIDWIPLGSADRVGVGLALGTGFLVSLSALPPPLSATEMVLRIAAVLSTMVVFAIERANPDMLIFILVILMLSLLRRSLIARLLAYCIAFLAGAIKYYPFILLSLIVRERIRVLFPAVIAAIIGLLFFFHIYAVQILEGLPSIASGLPFGDMFGDKNFLFGIVLVVRHITGSSNYAANAAIAATMLLIMVLVWGEVKLWSRSNLPAALYRLDERCRLALFAGVLLLLGCFFSGQSVGYRGIFLLLVLPGLFALGRDDAAGWAASAARWAAFSVPPLMWAEALRFWIHLAVSGHYPPPGFISVLDQPFDFLVWCVREIVWWCLMSFFLTILVGFLAGTPSFRILSENIWTRWKT